MGTEQNKQAVADFLACFTAGDFAGVLGSMTEDATWRIPGKPELSRIAGPKTKAQMARVFEGMGAQLKGGLKMTVHHCIAEGDMVAVEAESYGELRNGRIYNNIYHLAIQMRGDKICAVREYYDTEHVHAVWLQE